MANEETESRPREVKNHLLFEVATEVAHRGKFGSLACMQLGWQQN